MSGPQMNVSIHEKPAVKSRDSTDTQKAEKQNLYRQQ